MIDARSTLTQDEHENIEQASGGIPSEAVLREAERVFQSLTADSDQVLTEFSLRPASSGSEYSLLNVGEMVFEINSVTFDRDGSQHDAVTFIGESGRIHGIRGDGVLSVNSPSERNIMEKAAIEAAVSVWAHNRDWPRPDRVSASPFRSGNEIAGYFVTGWRGGKRILTANVITDSEGVYVDDSQLA